MKNHEFRQRLEKLAEKLTKQSYDAANRKAEAYCRQLDEVLDLSYNGPLANGLEDLIGRLVPASGAQFDNDEFDCGCRAALSPDIRRMLVQYFQVPRMLSYTEFDVVDEPDPARPDRDNLRSHTLDIMGPLFVCCGMLDRTLWDVFHMLGRLAHNVKSVFLPRVVQFLVDMDDAHEAFNWRIPADRAEQLADEFIACWKLVLKEVSLLGDIERPDVWPKRPTHTGSPVCGLIDTTVMTAEEATDLRLRYAREDYANLIAKLTSESTSGKDAFATLASDVRRLASAFEKPKMAKHLSLPSVDYAFLERLLSVDTCFYYSWYEDDEYSDGGELCEYPGSATTPEDKAKRKIVADLERFLTRACKLAKKIGSKSYDDLARGLKLSREYHGEFYQSDGGHELQLAARDLQLFIGGLKRSIPVLSADVENYVPPKAAASKRKKKFQHEGNGLKGIKTRKQAEQKKVFDEFLKNKPVERGHGNTRHARAKQCWAEHPDWDKAATATGEERGYANPKSLAYAKYKV